MKISHPRLSYWFILRNLPDCDFFTSSLKLFCNARSPSNLASRPFVVILPSSSFSWYSSRHLAISRFPVFESGVNFHADNSFCVSSNRALVVCNSALTFWNSILTAGSSSACRRATCVGAWAALSSIFCDWKRNIYNNWNSNSND